MSKTEKRFYNFSGQDFTLVMGARWYLEYYVNNRGISERVMNWGGGLNRIKNLAEREGMYATLAAEIACPAGAESGILTAALEGAKHLLRPNTIRNHKVRIKGFNKWLDGKNPASVGATEATAFLQSLVKNGSSSGTVSAYRKGLAALYTKAKLPNPWAGLPIATPVHRSQMYFNPEQSALLMEYLRGNDIELGLVSELLFYCFIRPKEIRSLTVDSINIHAETITIPGTISKNKKTQTVAIPPGLMVSLLASGRLNAPGHFLLFGHAGKPGLIPVGVVRWNNNFVKVLAHCKIVGRYSLYSWKHTGAVMCVRAGINLKDLQLQLRHASLDQVNEYLKDLGVLDSKDLRSKYPTL